jgi:hypothetical protein
MDLFSVKNIKDTLPNYKMNQRDLVLRLLKISEEYNIDQKNLPALVIKATVISLKYIDTKSLFETLFPDHFADWKLITHNLKTTNALGDTEPWLCLLSLLEWPTLNDKLVERTYPPLAQIKSALKSQNIDQPGWTVACRVLILQLIQGLQSMHAIELLTSRTLQKNTRDSTMQLLASLYDSKHLPSAYLDTLAFILAPPNVAINSLILSQTMSIIVAQREEHKLNMKLKSIQLVALRPRLRDRLKSSLMAEKHMENVDGQLGTWDSYAGFCHTHRFPNNLSDRVKRQLYFLASQNTWEWRPHVSRFIHAEEMQARVQEHPVTQPDANVLNWVIENLSMDGRPPFPEMMAFKAKCFGSFPVIYVQKMTLTQVLRLYISAYQPASVWKDVWKSQIGILSPQISRDCEAFTVANTFAGEWIVGAMAG